jgi:hypothetical protein
VWGQGREMNQALYAHMNNKRKKIKIKKKVCCFIHEIVLGTEDEPLSLKSVKK